MHWKLETETENEKDTIERVYQKKSYLNKKDKWILKLYTTTFLQWKLVKSV